MITSVFTLLLLVYFPIWNLTSVALYIGISQFLVALSLDIQCHLDEIESEITFAKDPKGTLESLQIKTKLNAIFKFHSESLK